MHSDRQLIINRNSSETRIALLEKDRVAELFIERQRDRATVGNIYKGIVTRVLPGMQSAFINIGTERSAFLYGGDVVSEEVLRREKARANAEEDIGSEEGERRGAEVREPIEKILREGDEILVQVAKEPLGTKGARVTMYMSLPGRYLVLMPGFAHVGVSRRIDDETERTRLKEIVKAMNPGDVGVIVRTAAAQADEVHLQKDLKYLLKCWETIQKKIGRLKAPALLFQELDLIQKTTRDLYSEEISRIVVDNLDSFEDLKRFLQASIPGAAKKLELYDKKTPIFDVYGVEMDISRALGNRIELPSGGYLIIDQTEALTSFDVNTGKFVGQFSARETILRTNLEAVKKVVAQLRIRNIGGIIVIDFIDMEVLEDREQVFNELQEELRQDKARTNVLKISELGLVQMTRKRTHDSLERQLMEPCSYCDGRGRIRSTITEAYDLIREIIRTGLQTGQKKIRVKVRKDISHWLLMEEKNFFDSILKDNDIEVQFVPASLSLDDLQEAAFEVLTV